MYNITCYSLTVTWLSVKIQYGKDFGMQKNKNKIVSIAAAVCALSIICAVCMGAVYDAAGINVSINEINEFENIDKTVDIHTRSTSVDEVLGENNFEVGIFDNISAGGDMENNSVVTIRRGVGITIECDGVVTATSTTHKNVSQALAENGYFIGESDYTVPSAEECISDGGKITVVRVSSSEQVRDEVIPYETIYKDDSSVYEGEKKTAQKGVNGIIRITESVVSENGAEVSRSETSRVTVSEKLDEIILCGTKKKEIKKPETKKAETKKSAAKKTTEKKQEKSSASSREDVSYKKVMSMTATAYSAFKKGGGYGKTASGRTAGHGIVAVDPRVIPLGTKVYVEGYGYAVAADTGGAIKGNKIDLCFEKSNSELMAFGRKNVKVYIIG